MRAARKAVAAVAALALLASLAACTTGGPVAPNGGDGPAAGSWTVLTYSIADTDLEPFMMADLGEMGEVGSHDGLNLVALVDRSADYSTEPVLGQADWTGGKLLHVLPGGAEVMDDLGPVDTGDPAVLSSFITRGITAFPAEHYAVIVSDHGASWPGVGGDESADGDPLSLAELNDAIGSGLSAAGVAKLDLLGFDACLMATYEVASTLAPRADRLLASQELEPGHGWNYTALEPAAQGATVDELGSALIQGFQSQAETEGDAAEITLSLVDLGKLPAVDAALAAFSNGLVERGSGIAPVVGRTLAGTLGFGRSPDPAEDSFMADLGILAGEIGQGDTAETDAAGTLVRAISSAAVDKVDGQSTAGATGLSIYFPPQKAYFADDYRALGTAGGWLDFLTSYYAAGGAIPGGEKARFTDSGAEVSFGADGLSISATLDPAGLGNAASASVRYGLIEADGSVTYLGERPATVDTGGSGRVHGGYDLTQLTLGDGTDTTPAYAQFGDDTGAAASGPGSGSVTVDVPMAYYSPGDVAGETYQDVLLSLTLDGASGEIRNETYFAYDDKLGSYGELTADPTGIIVPERLNVQGDGTESWVGTSDYGLYADLPALHYAFARLPSGSRLRIDLTVTDFGGNSASVSGTATVP
ncbi:clostripain-related cysteine peptidase [Cryobacterium zhongshanensis]|uniref:Clostripain-related cysteine peptidase n=1 Tax=Cryobacterium zhongshanensis TaxID=2928153 RepID=A0AA41UE11_9MICO|nr:clostripain-related cysteine peptidase [Cryobacterium zhongshanensis]MCI4656540.1 clostripain-related cysteine peptidase [Cryobacterium zhongshanensis]